MNNYTIAGAQSADERLPMMQRNEQIEEAEIVEEIVEEYNYYPSAIAGITARHIREIVEQLADEAPEVEAEEYDREYSRGTESFDVRYEELALTISATRERSWRTYADECSQGQVRYEVEDLGDVITVEAVMNDADIELWSLVYELNRELLRYNTFDGEFSKVIWQDRHCVEPK